MWYKILMGIALPLLAVLWGLYWWRRKLDQEEAAMPKEETSSDGLKKSRSEVADWAQQMASFKKPEHKPPAHHD